MTDTMGGGLAAAKVGSDHRALRDLVCDALRERIMDGSLAPGERLVEDRLAAELGVSRNPVREALRVLAVEGYVALVPRRGAEVATLSPAVVEDIFEVRQALEALGARLACRNATPEGLARLREVLAEAEAAIDEPGGAARLPALNTRFHELVLEQAANPVLAGVMEPLRGRMQWIFSRTARARAPHSLAEHRALVDAIAARDEEEAARLAVAHVGSALATYRGAVDAGGDGAERA